MNNQAPVSEIIRLRTSQRTYHPEPFTDDLRMIIERQVSAITTGFLGGSLSFSLISLKDPIISRMKLGTYGFIKGASYFIAGQITPVRNSFLEYGFALEKLILDLTRMELGTCWLGGTFNRGEFARAIGLREGNVIPAITPLGYATSIRRLGDRMIRLGAGSARRLPAGQLFFDQNPANPMVMDPELPFTGILEAVRMAPSASNNQPWRIVADGNRFLFYICRKPGYQKAFSNVDMQMIDMGIAMAHFDLVAREKGKKPEWDNSVGSPSVDQWEYVISVFLP